MPNPVDGGSSGTNWGQTKKAESGSGDTSGTTEPPSDGGTSPDSPETSTPSATTTIPVLTYSSGPAAQIEPVPVRLRELIVEYAARDVPVKTVLHSLSLRGSAPENAAPLAPETVERTRAQIVASASLALIAQANYSQQTVRALLGEAQAA